MDDFHNDIDKAVEQIEDVIRDFVTNLKGLTFLTPRVLQLHAKVLAIMSHRADTSSRRLEILTEQLIELTKAIKWLTVAVIAVGAVSIVFPYVMRWVGGGL